MNIQMTIELDTPALDNEEIQEVTQLLQEQILENDFADRAELVALEQAPRGAKSFGGFLIGMLAAEVNPGNFKKLMRFLGDRLGQKSIKLKLKAPDGREIELAASSQEEFDFVMKAAQKFLQLP